MALFKTFAPTAIQLAYHLALYLAKYDTQLRARNSLSTEQQTALTNLETSLAAFKAAFAQYEELP